MWVITLNKISKLSVQTKKAYFLNNTSKLLTRNMVLKLFEEYQFYRMNDKIYCEFTDECLGTIKRVLADKIIPEGKPKVKIKQYVKIIKKPIIELRPMNLREMQLEVVKKALELCNGNKTKASKILGISLTQTKRLAKCI